MALSRALVPRGWASRREQQRPVLTPFLPCSAPRVPRGPGVGWVCVLLIALVKFNSCSIKFIHLKCENQYVFASLIVQPSPQSDSVRFLSPLKESPAPTGRRRPPPALGNQRRCLQSRTCLSRTFVYLGRPRTRLPRPGLSRAGSRRPSTRQREAAPCSFSLLNELREEPTSPLSVRDLVDICVVSTCPHYEGCCGHSCARFRVHVFSWAHAWGRIRRGTRHLYGPFFEKRPNSSTAVPRAASDVCRLVRSPPTASSIIAILAGVERWLAVVPMCVSLTGMMSSIFEALPGHPRVFGEMSFQILCPWFSLDGVSFCC